MPIDWASELVSSKLLPFGRPDLPPKSLKRKLQHSHQSAPRAEQYYPSPPMSRPPSPPRSARDDLAPIKSQPTAPSPIAPSSYRIHENRDRSQLSASIAPPVHFPPTTQGPYGAHQHSSLPASRSTALSGYAASEPPPSLPEPGESSSPRIDTPRRPKPHVASACINCKKAHLSCDVQRPCGRCVLAGKEMTCVDVEHKKRGRPKLRAEGQVRGERVSTDLGPGLTPSSSTIPSTSRRIIEPQRRSRNDSLRSMQSTASDDPPGHLSSPGIASTGQPLFHSYHASAGPPSEPARNTPTAFLDLDLTIIRANQAFRDFVYGGQELAGSGLSSVVTSADGHGLDPLLLELRAARESREPSLMPPIVGRGEDPSSGVSERDIERVCLGQYDRTYVWRRTRAAPTMATFPARVRLAKVAAYFVVVTLAIERPLPPDTTGDLSSLVPTFPPPPGFGYNLPGMERLPGRQAFEPFISGTWPNFPRSAPGMHGHERAGAGDLPTTSHYHHVNQARTFTYPGERPLTAPGDFLPYPGVGRGIAGPLPPRRQSASERGHSGRPIHLPSIHSVPSLTGYPAGPANVQPFSETAVPFSVPASRTPPGPQPLWLPPIPSFVPLSAPTSLPPVTGGMVPFPPFAAGHSSAVTAGPPMTHSATQPTTLQPQPGEGSGSDDERPSTKRRKIKIADVLGKTD